MSSNAELGPDAPHWDATPPQTGEDGTNPMPSSQPSVDYCSRKFAWSEDMKTCLRDVFGFETFRADQEVVCNANLAGRDTLCIMPTGSGKSITYQLPALLSSGVTVVIEPLLSLITDQIAHLKVLGVEAFRLTSETEDFSGTFRRLRNCASNAPDEKDDQVKLLYVTPERIANPYFLELLKALLDGSKLARFVIDEAHCISQATRDYRPDYKKLYVLRKFFPEVPIAVLTATCSKHVLQEILSVLGLSGLTNPEDASMEGTVYFFTSPYRPNLHYSVRHKDKNAKNVLDDIAGFIKTKYSKSSGIIYCLSKKDTESVAKGLKERGLIRTGVYHASRTPAEKDEVYNQWKIGEIMIICATTAFGLGIDKRDVRFVIHHAIPKSLDGLCQESGRAGRDGKDADCILYYNINDVSRLLSMTQPTSGADKDSGLFAMFQFAENLQECRRLHFVKYFHEVSMKSFKVTTINPCGYCDICSHDTHAVGPIQQKDVAHQAWKLIMILQYALRQRGKLTMRMLADLAGGGRGGDFVARTKNEDGCKEPRSPATTPNPTQWRFKKEINLQRLCLGVVDLRKKDIEKLVVELLLRGYLKPEVQRPAEGRPANVYMALGPKSQQFLHFTREDVEFMTESGSSFPPFYCSFRGSISHSLKKKNTTALKVINNSSGEDSSDDSQCSDWRPNADLRVTDLKRRRLPERASSRKRARRDQYIASKEERQSSSDESDASDSESLLEFKIPPQRVVLPHPKRSLINRTTTPPRKRMQRYFIGGGDDSDDGLDTLPSTPATSESPCPRRESLSTIADCLTASRSPKRQKWSRACPPEIISDDELLISPAPSKVWYPPQLPMKSFSPSSDSPTRGSTQTQGKLVMTRVEVPRLRVQSTSTPTNLEPRGPKLEPSENLMVSLKKTVTFSDIATIIPTRRSDLEDKFNSEMVDVDDPLAISGSYMEP